MIIFAADEEGDPRLRGDDSVEEDDETFEEICSNSSRAVPSLLR
jgi:hypothetical protein